MPKRMHTLLPNSFDHLFQKIDTYDNADLALANWIVVTAQKFEMAKWVKLTSKEPSVDCLSIEQNADTKTSH